MFKVVRIDLLFLCLNCNPKLGFIPLTFSGKKLLRLPVYEITFYHLKKIGQLLTFTILLSGTLYGQNSKKDSLEQVVNSSSGKEKYDALIALMRIEATSDNNKALQLTMQARQIAVDSRDSTKIIDTSRILGILLNRLGRYKEAETLLLESLPAAKRHNLMDAYKVMLNNLATAYTFQAKYDKALEANFQTLLLREADNEMVEASISLNNIGVVYFKLKNYPTALEFYNQSLKVKRQVNSHFDLDRLLINIGLCYNQIGDFTEALQYFDMAFKECGENCSDPIKVEGKFGIGVAHYRLENFSESIKHFTESYSIAKKNGNLRFEAENMIYLGRIYVKKMNRDSALIALNTCEQIAGKNGYNELLIDSYKEFSRLYNQEQDFERASVYQSKYIALKDSIISQDIITKLAKIQTDFAERENIKTIADKEEVIVRQRNLSLLIITIAVLATLLIFVLYRSNRTKKRVNQQLSDAKAIIEDQNRKLLSSNFNLNRELKEKNIELEKVNESLLRVNEELDNFIYKTSHDIRGPLASLKGMCNVALMDVKDPLALGYLKKLDITAEKLNTILTRLLIVNQINNSTLGNEKIDFEGIVSDVLLLEKKKGLPPRLLIRKHIDDAIDFYSDKEFVRIILENLIDNAIKFYNDSERIDPFVDISVTEEEEHIKIRVVDNGIGISEVHPDKIFQMFSRASERSETGGIGLYITKTATEKLGGSVHLKTTPEGYTEFFVTLPLSSARVMA
jgi:signal transduction histidine kinase